MSWLTSFVARLKTAFVKKSLSRQLDQELRSHREMLTEENIRRGMTAEEAGRERQSARRRVPDPGGLSRPGRPAVP